LLTGEEVGGLVCSGISPLCFTCEGNADFIPRHLWYEQDVFLLGIADTSFIASWDFGGLDCEPEALSLRPITHAAWYALKTGDIRVATLKPSLSSSPKVLILDLEKWGQSE
jgi:hypothetical protein